MWFEEFEAFLNDVSGSSTENQNDDSCFEELDAALNQVSNAESQDDDSLLSNSQDDGSLFSNREVYLSTSRLNDLVNMNNRVETIVLLIESVDMKGLLLDEAPANEEFGRRVSQAVLSNPHFTSVVFWPDDDVAVRDLIPWLSCHGATLVHLRSLVKVDITGAEHLTMQDWDCMFSLLRTSMSLKELEINFFGRNGREDEVMSSIARFLGGSFLTKFKYRNTYRPHVSFSGAAFASLCDSIAESSLRELTLPYLHVTHAETAAEFLARAIFQSSLEQVHVTPQMIWPLALTRPVRDLDFAFDEFFEGNLIINRKWKPLLSANVPLGLWPHILKKAHASPELSHGTVGILFILLKEKCDLVPRSTP